MPSYCCVHEPHEASKSLFGVPKNAEIKILSEGALGMQLKKSHRVCAKHFYESDIVSTWDSGQGSSKYTVCLKKLQLKKGAIPINIKHDNINICNKNVVLPLGLTPSLNINKQIDFGNISNCVQTFIEPFIPSNALIPPESQKRKIDTLNPSTLLYQLVVNNRQMIDVLKNWLHSNKIAPIDIVFHTLSTFKSNYSRYIEKQLIIKNGVSLFIISVS